MESKTTVPRWTRHLWWLLALVSLFTLAIWLRPEAGFAPDWEAIALAAALIAWLANNPIPVGDMEVSLAHALSLTIGLALGAGAASVALLAGMALGEIVHSFRLWAPRQPHFVLRRLRSWALAYSTQMLSLTGGMAVYQVLGGKPLIEEPGLPPTIPATSFGIIFGAFAMALIWVSLLLWESRRLRLGEGIILILILLLPIPFSVVGAASLAILGNVALAVFGGAIAVLSPVVRNLIATEQDLQRRVEELSTLNRVSQAIRTSLDMDALLTTIYLQVAHLLKVDSFYIALHDPDDDQLSYPLAVKNGVRQHWPNRPLADRLTDRVIRTAAPILIQADASISLEEMGFPELQNPPEAWLGVPLLNPERAIGCMAVFHNKPVEALSEKDLQVLVTLAGQASVAIENALLYEQTRQRAAALGSLNEITASMSSTLDPDRALELVSQSMIRVGGGQKSAIYLLDSERGLLFLARATNLSDDSVRSWQTLALDEKERTKAYRSRVPVLVSDLSRADLPEPFVQQLRSERIRAYADFPLITPSGTIGQLSVYFSEPQHFRASQVELLKTFAAQAALAVANARAHAETDEALRVKVDQLSTLEAIGRQMAGTLDPQELFETIIEHALRFTRAPYGHVAVFDSPTDTWRVATSHGYPPNSPPEDAGRVHPLELGIPGKAMRGGQLFNVADVHNDPDHVDWNQGQTRSLLCVPMHRQERCIGAITVESDQPSAFGEQHEQFLTQLAAQAGVALTNANLYQQIEARLREQSLLFQASTQIARTLESEAVVTGVADSMAVALFADGASVSRWDLNTRTLNLRAVILDGRPLREPWIATVSMSDAPALARCIKEGKPSQWSLSTATSAPDRRYLREFRHTDSLLAVPLMVGGETLGVVEVFSHTPRQFDENEIRTAQTIASQGAIALQNTELFRRISESRDRLMAVLNSTREGMLMADPFGRVVVANRQLETLTGLQTDALVGKSLADNELRAASRLGYRPGELASLLAGLRSGQAMFGGVSTYELSGPTRRTLQRSETAVRDAEGQIVGWMVVLRDVSEERELEEARNHLTEMIVHDLRSPLTVILSSLSLLEKSGTSKAKPQVLEQALSVARRSVQQMLGLVTALLDIAKLESGELKLNLQTVSLEKVSEELISTYTQEAINQGILLEHNLAKGVPEIRADQEKLQRVVANLLDNALKFTPPGGRVELLIEDAGDDVLITVTDTGPGVPEEFRERIFERFSQVPGTTSSRRGTGLGLAFAKLAVEAHSGQIWVEENPGSGSRFRVRLPTQPTPKEARPA